MADTGFKAAATVVSAGSWTNFTAARLNSANDTRTTTTTTAYTAGVIRDFAFGVPSNATITGIEIQVEMSPSNTSSTATVRTSLSHNAGTNYTATSAEVTATGSSTDVVRTMGGSSDTWGRSWTPAELNDATNFYVKLEGKNSAGGTVNTRIDYVLVKVHYTVPKWDTISDDFNTGTTLDSTKWTNWGGANVTLSSGQVNINSGTAASSYYGFDSLYSYDLTGSSVHIQVVQAGAQAAAYGLYPVQLQVDANNQVYWYINNGNAQAWKVVAGAYSQVGSSRTHTDGDWYRIREASGTTYWEYSTTGTSWTALTSQANPTAVTSLLNSTFTELTSASTARTAILDNFNITPSVPAANTSSFFQFF